MNPTSDKTNEVQSFYATLTGTWEGQYSLWLHPGAPEEKSPSKAKIAIGADKAAWTMDYTWAKGPQAHTGKFEFTGAQARGEFRMTDSFHTPASGLEGAGKLSEDGTQLIFMSHYPAEQGPDWGWRTEFKRIDSDTFLMQAYNITPQGQEALAVSCKYVKK